MSVRLGSGSSMSIGDDSLSELDSPVEKKLVENEVRYCCCLTEKQLKQMGISIGSILIIAGVAGVVFGVFMSAWFLVAACSLSAIGGIGLIYFAEQMEGLGHEVDELIGQINKTKTLVANLGRTVINETRNNARLAKEIDRLKEARRLIVGDLQKALDELKELKEILEKTVRDTNAEIEKAVRERLEELSAGIDDGIKELREGSDAYIALTETLADKQAEIDRLTSQLAEKDGEIARLKKLLPKEKK